MQADQDADLAGRGRAVVPPGLCGTAALGFRQRLPARIHRCQHRGIGQGHRRALGIGHHHGIAALGFAEQLLREGLRQAHAAVRSRVARQAAAMQGDAIPGQPLHVGHRRAVVEVGPVVLVLLQDGEHTGRCLVPGLSRADRGQADGDAVAVHVGPLLIQADHQHDRAGRRDFRMPQELARLEVGRPAHVRGAGRSSGRFGSRRRRSGVGQQRQGQRKGEHQGRGAARKHPAVSFPCKAATVHHRPVVAAAKPGAGNETARRHSHVSYRAIVTSLSACCRPLASCAVGVALHPARGRVCPVCISAPSTGL